MRIFRPRDADWSAALASLRRYRDVIQPPTNQHIDMQPPTAPLASARDARSVGIPSESARTFVAGFLGLRPQMRTARRSFRLVERLSRLTSRGSRESLARPTPAWRWVAFIYVVIAVAAPLIMYVGPDVMSPAAPVIADGALDGDLPQHLREHPGVAMPAR